MEQEQVRLERFRRLRRDIRGCEDYLVIGIDVAKDKHNAFMGTHGEDALQETGL